MTRDSLFDDWPEKYDQWFATPIGRLVKRYEAEMIMNLLRPAPGERILDAGCGTGIFTLDILARKAVVFGLELSLPMLLRAKQKFEAYSFHKVIGDMANLPFAGNAFDKSVSITAIEFVSDAVRAIEELFRVTKPGGCVVVATLNRLSSWAVQRKERAQTGQSRIFEKAVFRSPGEISDMFPLKGVIKTAIHFQRDDDPDQAQANESEGQRKGLTTGAFVIGRWEKP
jgi:ubiquinone/menaquinone biosynthesis C-methylase UbiE